MSVVNITSTNSFESTLTRANKSQVIAVHWTAKWCGPCKRISPAFDELARNFPRSKFLRIDVDDNKELAMKAKVSKLPTFTFYNGSTLLTNETLQGPTAAKLKEVVERLDKARNPFAGSGHSLTASSSTSSSGGGATGAAPADAKPKRFNPWAQKNFVPPGMRAQEKEKASTKAKEEEEARKKSQGASSQGKSPWADPNFKPKEAEAPKKPEAAASSSSGMTDDGDDELQKALKMSLEESGGDKMTDDDGVTKSSEGNDPSLVKTINQDLLKQVMDMGYTKIRAEKSLILTKSKNLEAALNWLISNEKAPDVDEPLKVVGSAPSSSSKPPKKVWGANEKGAPLGWKPGVEYEDEDELGDDLLANIRKKNAKYKSSASKTETKKPMTKEEKLKDLEERRARRKDDMIKEDLAKQKSNAKSRMTAVKEMAELKRQRAEQEQKLMLDKKRREKERDKERKRKMKEKTRLEKERRKREAEERKKRLEELKAAKAAGKA